jgi:hypothetical protein
MEAREAGPERLIMVSMEGQQTRYQANRTAQAPMILRVSVGTLRGRGGNRARATTVSGKMSPKRTTTRPLECAGRHAVPRAF